jgi:hypothetical protein
VDYSVTANRAVFDFASRNREQLLMNIWKAASNQIERGSRDHWTVTPKRMEALYAVLEENDATEQFVGPQTGALKGYFSLGSPPEYFAELRKPQDRDPRGYILPSHQADFPTATKFVNTLIKNGVRVHRATSDFQVGGMSFPEDSWVVFTAQAYRAHVMDMFEPQDHPNDFAYEGGPPVAPYDNAGYTLAYQMGVEFHRVLDPFDGPFQVVEGLVRPAPERVAHGAGAAGFLLSHAERDVATVTNRLLGEGHRVRWLTAPMVVGGEAWPAGTVYVPSGDGIQGKLEAWARELGVRVQGVPQEPTVGSMELSPVRIGLWDEYGGSIPSGWTRFLFDQFEFPYEVVYPQTLDAGNLRDRFDVLVFVTGAIPQADQEGADLESFFYGGPPENVPEAYAQRVGSVTVANTVPQLLAFMEEGGTIIAMGSSISMARHAGLGLSPHLVDEGGTPLGEEEYYVPGSVLQVRVDNTLPIAYGLPPEVDIFFNNSPVLRLPATGADSAVEAVAWFDSPSPLRSGWAWGQEYLNGGLAAGQAEVGEGKLYFFGPEITNRGQPHGTFPFLFNGIFLAGAR